ncbi:MAG: 50S ribosomal protein L18 [Thermoanaerobaculia bacterium]
MDRAKERVQSRGRVRERIRRKINGTSDRPRLAVFKSLKHIYVQLIDDATGNTIVSASTHEKAAGAKGANAAAAKGVGALIAKKAQDKGVKRVVFDRGGYLYHGNIKALADAARENGLEF